MTRRKTFTLIELLVVIAIISILASALMPAFSGARSTAKLALSVNNMRQLVSASVMYANDYDFYVPLTNLNPHAGHIQGVNWGRLIYEHMTTEFPVNGVESAAVMRSSQWWKIMNCPYLLAQRGEYPTHAWGRSHYSINHYFYTVYRKPFTLIGAEPFMVAGTPKDVPAGRTYARARFSGSVWSLDHKMISYQYPGNVGLTAYTDGSVAKLTIAEGTALDADVADDETF